MSNLLNYIKNNNQETQRLVGVKYEQLEQLIKQALALQTEKQQESQASKVRIIKKGGGRKAGGTHLIEHCSSVMSIF